MKISNLVAAATIGLTTIGTAVAPALADTNYVYNEYVGDIWVGTMNLYKNRSGGVTAAGRVNLPTCSAFSNLAGYLNFSYVADDGGYFSNYKFYVGGLEGRNNVEAFVNVPYNMSTNGRMLLTDNTYCDVF